MQAHRVPNPLLIVVYGGAACGKSVLATGLMVTEGWQYLGYDDVATEVAGQASATDVKDLSYRILNRQTDRILRLQGTVIIDCCCQLTPQHLDILIATSDKNSARILVVHMEAPQQAEWQNRLEASWKLEAESSRSTLQDKPGTWKAAQKQKSENEKIQHALRKRCCVEQQLSIDSSKSLTTGRSQTLPSALRHVTTHMLEQNMIVIDEPTPPLRSTFNSTPLPSTLRASPPSHQHTFEPPPRGVPNNDPKPPPNSTALHLSNERIERLRRHDEALLREHHHKQQLLRDNNHNKAKHHTPPRVNTARIHHTHHLLHDGNPLTHELASQHPELTSLYAASCSFDGAKQVHRRQGVRPSFVSIRSEEVIHHEYACGQEHNHSHPRSVGAAPFPCGSSGSDKGGVASGGGWQVVDVMQQKARQSALHSRSDEDLLSYLIAPGNWDESSSDEDTMEHVIPSSDVRGEEPALIALAHIASGGDQKGVASNSLSRSSAQPHAVTSVPPRPQEAHPSGIVQSIYHTQHDMVPLTAERAVSLGQMYEAQAHAPRRYSSEMSKRPDWRQDRKIRTSATIV